MKFRLENRYLHWGLTAFLVVAASMLFYYAIFHMGTVISGIKFVLGILAPIIYGFVIAYILSSIVSFFEETIVFRILNKKNIALKKRGKRLVRWLCVIFSTILLYVLIYALIMMILPQLVKSITNIIYSFPHYVAVIEKWMNSIIEKGWNLDEKSIDMLNKYSTEAQNYLTGTILPKLQGMLINISSGVFNVLAVIKNILIGTIVALYLLVDKESFIAKGKMLLYACMSAKHVNALIHSLRFTNSVFGGFISGKLLDSAIIGVLCYIGITIMDMPYTILVSVIIGVTNVIPFFGPYLGGIPCSILILLVNPMKGLYFIIFILILQQFDGNILGPKILGDSTGLSSFMVIVAILIGGGFFGIGGMIIGVPICAVIYASLSSILSHTLRSKNMPSEEIHYVNIDCLDPVSHEALELRKKPSYMEQHKVERSNTFTKVYNFIVKFLLIIISFLYEKWKIIYSFLYKKGKVFCSFCYKKLYKAYLPIKARILKGYAAGKEKLRPLLIKLKESRRKAVEAETEKMKTEENEEIDENEMNEESVESVELEENGEIEENEENEEE